MKKIIRDIKFNTIHNTAEMSHKHLHNLLIRSDQRINFYLRNLKKLSYLSSPSTLKCIRDVTGRGKCKAALEAACRRVESETDLHMPLPPPLPSFSPWVRGGGRNGGRWSSASPPLPGMDPDLTKGEGGCGVVGGVRDARGVAGVELALAWGGWWWWWAAMIGEWAWPPAGDGEPPAGSRIPPITVSENTVAFSAFSGGVRLMRTNNVKNLFLHGNLISIPWQYWLRINTKYTKFSFLVLYISEAITSFHIFSHFFHIYELLIKN